MNPSEFEHLRMRFTQRHAEIKRSKKEADFNISGVMSTAGKLLFAKISSKEIDLGDTPDWFTKEPEGPVMENLYGTCQARYSWDFYWMFAIRWLAKNRLDSGITFGISLYPLNEDHMYSGEDVETPFHYLFRQSDQRLKKAWLKLAKASEDACLYLARISKEPATAKSESLPVQNIHIRNFEGVLGNVKAKNVQTGDHTSINKYDDIGKKEHEGLLEPKPPEILQKLLWICKHGRKHWKLILLAIAVLLLTSIFILPRFDLFSKIFH